MPMAPARSAPEGANSPKFSFGPALGEEVRGRLRSCCRKRPMFRNVTTENPHKITTMGLPRAPLVPFFSPIATNHREGPSRQEERATAIIWGESLRTVSEGGKFNLG